MSNLHQRRYELRVPGAHGLSKGSRRAKSAQAASTAVQVVRALEAHRSSKGSRRSEVGQAVALAG